MSFIDEKSFFQQKLEEKKVINTYYTITIIYLFNLSQEIKKSYLKPKKVIKQRILKFKKIILKEFGKFSLVPSEKKRPLFCRISS